MAKKKAAKKKAAKKKKRTSRVRRAYGIRGRRVLEVRVVKVSAMTKPKKLEAELEALRADKFYMHPAEILDVGNNGVRFVIYHRYD